MQGKLYMVATPIGNLADMTYRAVETLHSVDLILAEDTRVTKKLLQKFEISTPLDSFHAHSPHEQRLSILNNLMQGKNIALVTDAGTPGISDPGNELLDFLYANFDGFTPVPIPGASAVTGSLSVSGFDTNSFIFLGFWPKSTRKDYFDMVESGDFTVCYFDSPHRLLKNLYKLEEIVNKDRRVLVSRELTKLYETLYRGTISEVIKMIEEEKSTKGEVVVIIERAKNI